MTLLVAGFKVFHFSGIPSFDPGRKRFELRRIRGCALLGLGRADEARAALEESLRDGRVRNAPFEVALTLEAMIQLERSQGVEPELEWVAERDQIYQQLGVVSPPPVR